jgi:hypothetical protein
MCLVFHFLNRPFRHNSSKEDQNQDDTFTSGSMAKPEETGSKPAIFEK